MSGTLLCTRKTILVPLGAGIALCLLSSCFTGVESTPRIDDSELRRAKVTHLSEEDVFLSDVTPAHASEWKAGHRLIVADPKVRLVLTGEEGAALPELIAGDVLTFKYFEPAVNLMGNEAVDVVFASDRYPELRYRLPATMSTLSGTESPVIEVPFTVDPALAELADSLVSIRKDEPLYILSPLWYDAATEKAVSGYRLIGVHADSVRPGNHIFPLKLYFHVADAELAQTAAGRGEKMVYMSHGGKPKGSTRTFAGMFSFQEQRKRFPHITDEVWRLIINSRVQEGMTKDECRLALGSPATVDLTPTRTGDVERWGYSDGVYLIFNTDGTLMRYRL